MTNTERPSRAQKYMALALTPPLGLGLEPATPIAASVLNNEIFRIYDLLREEEELAPRLQTESQTFTLTEIGRIIVLVIELAAAGYPTALVETDEMLDICQLFTEKKAITVHAHRIFDHIDTWHAKYGQSSGDPVRRTVATRQLSERRLIIPRKPSQSDAQTILTDLVTHLQEKGNSAWTTRVVAALAYLSSISEVELA